MLNEPRRRGRVFRRNADPFLNALATAPDFQSQCLLIITMSDSEHRICGTTLIIRVFYEVHVDGVMMYAVKHLPKFYVAY